MTILFWDRSGSLREGIEVCKTRKGRKIQLKDGKVITVPENRIRAELKVVEAENGHF